MSYSADDLRDLRRIVPRFESASRVYSAPGQGALGSTVQIWEIGPGESPCIGWVISMRNRTAGSPFPLWQFELRYRGATAFLTRTIVPVFMGAGRLFVPFPAFTLTLFDALISGTDTDEVEIVADPIWTAEQIPPGSPHELYGLSVVTVPAFGGGVPGTLLVPVPEGATNYVVNAFTAADFDLIITGANGGFIRAEETTQTPPVVTQTRGFSPTQAAFGPNTVQRPPTPPRPDAAIRFVNNDPATIGITITWIYDLSAMQQ